VRRATVLCGIMALILALPAWGKKHESKYRSIEVKHFTLQEGMQLPPGFLDLIYAEIRSQASKTGLFEDVISEGEVVDVGEADTSLILEGNVLKFIPGPKGMLSGRYMPFQQSLTADFTVHRRSDGAKLLEKEVTVKAPVASPGIIVKRQGPESLAQLLSAKILNDLKSRM